MISCMLLIYKGKRESILFAGIVAYLAPECRSNSRGQHGAGLCYTAPYLYPQYSENLAPMDTSAALSVGLPRRPAGGWAVALLSRLQTSSIMLTSFTLGVFLPFIRQDLQLSPLQAGLLQGVSWITTTLMALPSG